MACPGSVVLEQYSCLTFGTLQELRIWSVRFRYWATLDTNPHYVSALDACDHIRQAMLAFRPLAFESLHLLDGQATRVHNNGQFRQICCRLRREWAKIIGVSGAKLNLCETGGGNTRTCMSRGHPQGIRWPFFGASVGIRLHLAVKRTPLFERIPPLQFAVV